VCSQFKKRNELAPSIEALRADGKHQVPCGGRNNAAATSGPTRGR